MRCITIIKAICAAFLLVGLLTPALPAAEPNTGAAAINLNGGSRGVVPFPHQKHEEALGDCQLCHAHFPQASGSIDALKAKGELSSKWIMNKLCVKCHREKKRAGLAAGPTQCSACHQR